MSTSGTKRSSSSKDSHTSKRSRRSSDSSRKKSSTTSRKSRKGTRFVEWLDQGSTAELGKVEHKQCRISIDGESFNLAVGDVVTLRNPNKTSYTDAAPWMVRLECLWEEARPAQSDQPAAGLPMLRARRLMTKADILGLGPISTDNLARLSEMFMYLKDDKHIALSDISVETKIKHIIDPVQVLYCSPETAAAAQGSDSYVCLHTFEWHAVSPTTTKISPVLEYLLAHNEEPPAKKQRSESSPVQQEAPPKVETKQPTQTQPQTTATEQPASLQRWIDSDSISNYDSEEVMPTAAVDEGNGEQRDIREGPDHQAIVPAFVPSLSSKSRNPTQVWKSDQISDKDLAQFISAVSGILVPYLKEHNLTHTDPYSPLPWDTTEELTAKLRGQSFLTLSSFSTGSSLALNETDTLREMNIDALCRLLSKCNCDSQAALEVLKENPEKYVTTWTVEQKETLNVAFRRYAGSLRMVYKALAGEKTLQEVIDYVYRFKIPDQFRRFQETKQEQAVRIIESMESRRNMNLTIPTSGVESLDSIPRRRSRRENPQETRIGDITGSLDDRRVAAKRVLLDVEQEMGKDKLLEVLSVIKTFHKKPTADSRQLMVKVLQGHEHLQEGVLAFFPR
eukprot:Nitzschia sp. Nitz4//scaffold166_size90379//38179//40233//NITZ4_005055-RA/size90379-snap-gene-0.44-mRNA-1//1//CDS//3329538190//6212//frame0